MKKHQLLKVAVVAGMSVATMFGACAVSACSCAPPQEPKIALKNSTAVFSGKVLSIRKSEFDMSVRFRVTRVWKGVAASEVMLTTANESAACGYPFQVGASYLVYARAGGSKSLHASLCSRTARLADAKADLTQLGAGKAPPVRRK